MLKKWSDNIQLPPKPVTISTADYIQSWKQRGKEDKTSFKYSACTKTEGFSPKLCICLARLLEMFLQSGRAPILLTWYWNQMQNSPTLVQKQLVLLVCSFITSPQPYRLRAIVHILFLLAVYFRLINKNTLVGQTQGKQKKRTASSWCKIEHLFLTVE